MVFSLHALTSSKTSINKCQLCLIIFCGIKPMYVFLSSEPRHLTFGVMTTVLLYHLYGLVEGQSAVYVGEHLLVADGIEGVLVSEGAKPADFVEHSGSHHGIDALIDAVEELLAFAPETYLDGVEGTWLSLFCQEGGVWAP